MARFARELTAAVGIPILVFAIGWAPKDWFAVLLSAGVLLAGVELVLMSGRSRAALRVVPMLLAAAPLLAFAHAFPQPVPNVALLWFPAVAILLPACWLLGRGDLPSALPVLGAQLAAILLVVAPGAAILRLFLTDDGRFLITLVLVATWGGDAGAYYVGRKLGKHRLAPNVSPKKSWEGSIGGGITTVLITVGLCVWHRHSDPFRAALVGAAISVLGQLGDLAESMLKRSAGVKDSGSFLPGHGGFLDRIDSLLWSGPVVLVSALAGWI